ncbi:MAG TPA: hypothetical protein VFY65_06845 [Longimicrobium sp.]|nr:hypothetical protein [Longimicrobium sp.]
MPRLKTTDLRVDSFPVMPDDDGAAALATVWDSTGCCDTRLDCSSACREPTNICEVCG